MPTEPILDDLRDFARTIRTWLESRLVDELLPAAFHVDLRDHLSDLLWRMYHADAALTDFRAIGDPVGVTRQHLASMADMLGRANAMDKLAAAPRTATVVRLGYDARAVAELLTGLRLYGGATTTPEAKSKPDVKPTRNRKPKPELSDPESAALAAYGKRGTYTGAGGELGISRQGATKLIKSALAKLKAEGVSSRSVPARRQIPTDRRGNATATG